MQEGIIILGHGSRREDANEEIKELTAKLAKENPQTKYQEAYWQFGHPSLADAIERLINQDEIEKIIVMPMFLTVGNHMYKDIPDEILRLKTIYPGVKFAFAGHLGADRRIVEIAQDRIKDAKELP